MGIQTGIEWCDSTTNPIVGCEGCELWNHTWPDEKQHCYAATLVKRYGGKNGWPEAFDRPEFFPGRIEKALKWPDLTGTDRPDKPWLNKFPRLIFLNDLSDTFIRNPGPATWLPNYVEAMAASPHIWLFLTKRPATMYMFFKSLGYVPPNFWLGTTLTTPGTVKRAEMLTRIWDFASEALLWISAEPLLGDVVAAMEQGSPVVKIDWMVAGGESGANARPSHPDWARALREWSRCWGIPFFWKQWGKWLPEGQGDENLRPMHKHGLEILVERNRVCTLDGETFFWRVGKKDAGRLLDGREWSEMPEKCYA